MDRLIDFKTLKRVKEEEGSGLVDVTGLTKPKGKVKTKKASLQQLIKDNNSPINTKDITQALFIRFSNHRFIINNAYIFDGWESDFITVTESMYVYEIECKMSKSDFQDDFKKRDKHTLLESTESNNNLSRPNKFFYCAPRGLIASYEVPSYAGLMEVSRAGGVLQCTTVKEAPFIHKDDIFSSIKDSLLQKLSWRYRDIMLTDYENSYNILTDEEKSINLQNGNS